MGNKQTFFLIRKFLKYSSPQIANPQMFWLIRKSQIRKYLQKTAPPCLNSVLIDVFLNDFYNVQVWINPQSDTLAEGPQI